VYLTPEERMPASDDRKGPAKCYFLGVGYGVSNQQQSVTAAAPFVLLAGFERQRCDASLWVGTADGLTRPA
jgi:hypothetical protein